MPNTGLHSNWNAVCVTVVPMCFWPLMFQSFYHTTDVSDALGDGGEGMVGGAWVVVVCMAMA